MFAKDVSAFLETRGATGQLRPRDFQKCVYLFDMQQQFTTSPLPLKIPAGCDPCSRRTNASDRQILQPVTHRTCQVRLGPALKSRIHFAADHQRKGPLPQEPVQLRHAQDLADESEGHGGVAGQQRGGVPHRHPARGAGGTSHDPGQAAAGEHRRHHVSVT